MKNRLKAIFSVLKDTFDEWNKDRAPRLAAAISYYTVFSLAPFCIVVIAIAGLAFGQDAVRGQLNDQIQGLVGQQGADMIQQLIQNVSKPQDSIIATVIGLVTLLLGAAGLFGQLQDALNTVWGVETKPGRGIIAMLRDRFISFTMVLGVGFMLLVSLLISAFLAAIHNFFVGLIPGADFLLQVINFVISFGVITLLFAMMYKILPDVEIRWRDVWVGAAFTALLFTIGKQLLGLYLGNSGILSTYGAAGSLIIILLWIFYSAQILLFGAEFTQVYAQRYGAHIKASANAQLVDPEARLEQGMSVTQKASKTSPPLPMLPIEDNTPEPLSNKPLTTGAVAVGAAFFALLVGMVLGTQTEHRGKT